MKTKYYKATEEILYNYKNIKINLTMRKEELSQYENDYKESGIGYTVKSDLNVHQEEHTAFKTANRIEYIKRDIRHLETKIQSVEESLKLLNDTEIALIVMKYFQKESMSKMSSTACFSRSHTTRLNKQAINKLKVCFYGLNALEEDL